MPKRNTYQSYGSISKFFHWTIFLLVLVMIVFGFLLGDIPKEWKGLAYNTHKLIGLTILLLMLLRTYWALRNPKPKLPNSVPLWQVAFARLNHFLLYLALLAMPIAGWIMSTAADKAPKLFGYTLALPINPNETLSETAGYAHQILAYTIIALASIHILAALKHHFINKDNVLKRMLPGYKVESKKASILSK